MQTKRNIKDLKQALWTKKYLSSENGVFRKTSEFKLHRSERGKQSALFGAGVLRVSFGSPGPRGSRLWFPENNEGMKCRESLVISAPGF